jgi:hypothetical protein
MHPLRVGLAGLVDYAGLFPPAGLALPEVVSNVVRYRRSPEAWMLGRLIVPADSLAAAADHLEAFSVEPDAPRLAVSALVTGAPALEAAAAAIEAFNARMRERATAVASVEMPAAHPADVDALATTIPEAFERYLEVAPGPAFDSLLDRIAATCSAAKVRTGGLTADRIPASATLAAFILACHERRLPFKATAGLHHPVRAEYPLTYEAGSACATMHGFVNVLAATAMLHAGYIEQPGVVAVLDETDSSAFRIERDCLWWRAASVTADDLASCRRKFFRSVGSCSFEEPVEELRRLRWELR